MTNLFVLLRVSLLGFDETVIDSWHVIEIAKIWPINLI